MTAGSDGPDGIDGGRVGAWLEANVAGASGPFRYERIAGGLRRSEIVGLAPADAHVAAAEHYLRLEAFKSDQVQELRLLEE